MRYIKSIILICERRFAAGYIGICRIINTAIGTPYGPCRTTRCVGNYMMIGMYILGIGKTSDTGEAPGGHLHPGRTAINGT